MPSSSTPTPWPVRWSHRAAPACGRSATASATPSSPRTGGLDRAALGAVVFADDRARRDLEAITHPLIAARTAELVAGAPSDAVVVHDVPLLVEKHLGPTYHLVVVVGADARTRVERLVLSRGMAEADARARVAAQADDDQRRAAADVWLDNEGSPEALEAAVDRLWHERLVPFERNVRDGRRSRRPEQLHARGRRPHVAGPGHPADRAAPPGLGRRGE